MVPRSVQRSGPLSDSACWIVDGGGHHTGICPAVSVDSVARAPIGSHDLTAFVDAPRSCEPAGGGRNIVGSEIVGGLCCRGVSKHPSSDDEVRRWIEVHGGSGIIAPLTRALTRRDYTGSIIQDREKTSTPAVILLSLLAAASRLARRSLPLPEMERPDMQATDAGQR